MLTSAGGVDGPRYVIILNIAVTLAGVLLAAFVNLRFSKNANKTVAAEAAAR